jgi:hypothetical protein
LIYVISFLLSCFQRTEISMPTHNEDPVAITLDKLIQCLESLPPKSRVKLSVSIDTVDPIKGIQASIGGKTIELIDLTSMGLAMHSSVVSGNVIWLEGFWGAALDLPSPSHGSSSHKFSVVSVGGQLEGPPFLRIVHQDNQQNCSE